MFVLSQSAAFPFIACFLLLTALRLSHCCSANILRFRKSLLRSSFPQISLDLIWRHLYTGICKRIVSEMMHVKREFQSVFVVLPQFAPFWAFAVSDSG